MAGKTYPIDGENCLNAIKLTFKWRKSNWEKQLSMTISNSVL